ncbi:hypothetical protein BDP27DRAFT_1325557 [Rhodocollybia butyracea]|uniref:DUF6534 domain-containing protein n=1 Tax=Rhodocollybia butyracea TaxID=206335 RepID=A0A9P5PU50_9AGAR|nr:hypothetical protein BDP27DRAFT_1325557 [Rhodocollybia butyracea]
MSAITMIFGPMLVGVFLNCILYGVLSVQTFIYFQTYKKDSSSIRGLVSWYLYIMETLNTGFDMGLILEPLVVRYGTEEAVTKVPIMFAADPLVTVLIACPIQIFMAWRIKIISQSSWLMWIIIIFSISGLIGGIANAILTVLINEYSKLHQFKAAVVQALSCTAVTDILITCSLVWSLWKSRTHVRATDDAITRIIRLTVQTGLITSVSAILDFVLFLASPNTTVNFVWDFSLSKLYTNALLSTLNARHGWGNLNGPAVPGNSVLFQDSGGPSINTAIRFTRPPNAHGVRNPDTGIITTGVYELNIADQWGNTPVNVASVKPDMDKVVGREQDLERGIVVNTVASTLTDPTPKSNSA